MTTDIKASERPWRTDHDDRLKEIEILGPESRSDWAHIMAGDSTIAAAYMGNSYEDNLARAELIVRAVNSYDPALQDKLNQAVKALEEARDQIDDLVDNLVANDLQRVQAAKTLLNIDATLSALKEGK